MNTALPQQLAAAQESQIDLTTAVAQVLFSTAEQLTPLHIDTLRGGVQELARTVGQLQAAHTPQDLGKLQTSLSEASLETTSAYVRSVLDVTASAHADLLKILDTHRVGMERNVLATIEASFKAAPAGSDAFVSAFKSWFGAVQAGYDATAKASQQINDLAVANVKAATDAGQKVATTSRKTKQVS